MLKSLKTLQEHLRYLIDQAFARKFVGQSLLFVTLVVSVTLVGMTAMFFGLFSEDNADISTIPRDIDAGFLDSLWWSLNQVMRLPGFKQAYGATTPVVMYSLFLSLMGLVVFSVLISLINNTMRTRIEALRKGDTQVLERNHVLLLGWNNKVFSILQQLARLQPGVKVVILAPREIDMMQEQLRVAGIQREQIKVILRSGVAVPADAFESLLKGLNDPSAEVQVGTGEALGKMKLTDEQRLQVFKTRRIHYRD